VNRGEVRYRTVSALTQVGKPLTLSELVEVSGVTVSDLVPVLKEMVGEQLVVEGELVPDKPAPQYCWAARWDETAQRRTTSTQRALRKAMSLVERVPGQGLDVQSAPSTTFYDHVINEYFPPSDKRFLVFLQCSVRRPFSTSPSHAALRRAIRVATGYDPRKDFESCPVHVVVLASRIGPVPYELEDVYPANVRGGGVKHFSTEHYMRTKSVLAERMAEYVLAHGLSYERMATFTEGRYAEVMEVAQETVAEQLGEQARFPILPRIGGPRVVRMGQSTPRQYWARYWIQLYLEVVSWLTPEQQAQAVVRLNKLKVEHT
jgi:hypothetical protein